MLLIPAIDLKGGKVVRLFQGNGSDETVYSGNPVAIARHWKHEGAQMIHIVDLDGAFTGEPKNLPALKKIVQAVDVPVQFGGGLRTSAVIREVLDAGVSRVILGTKAVEDTDFLAEVLSEFPGKVLVSVDTKKGGVLTQGWQTESGQKVEAAAFGLRLKSCGVSEVVFTDTAKDGTLRGPNIEALTDFALKTQLRVIASGGISSLDDIKAIKKIQNLGISGVIIGKALYEERFSLKEAVSLFAPLRTTQGSSGQA